LAVAKADYRGHNTPLPINVPLRARALAPVLLVVALSGTYFGAIFRITDPIFWNAGLGDWQDPYFINFVLEHWYRAIEHVTDPSSPPMFFPARNGLGYSCTLILYAPFYLLVRPFVNPFQAYGLTLLLLVETGTVCLYLLLQKCLRLPVVTALLLTAFFVTSANIVNGLMFAWSQRASVFLIPPIVLMVVTSRGMQPGAARTALALASGCLSTLLLTNDFPSAYLAVFVGALAFAPLIATGAGPHVLRAARRLPASHAARLLLLLSVAAAAWSVATLITGGFTTQLFGIRISSRNWVRPAVVTAVAVAAFLYRDRSTVARTAFVHTRAWGLPFAIGLMSGTAAFLWMHLPAYRNHPTFPEQQLLDALLPANQLFAGGTARPFILVVGLAALAWLPASHMSGRARCATLWFAGASLVVLLVPVRFGDVSLWTTLAQNVPGAAAVRDAKRVMDSFELAVVLGAGLLLAQAAPGRVMQWCAAALLAILLIAGWRAPALDFRRPYQTFARWVEAPIAIDPSCRSFFVAPASRDYTTRPDSVWSLYDLDAMFIALQHRIPTLNGYSAWGPEGWTLANPDAPGYLDVVSRWISDHALTGVCALDIERRTMRPVAG
jgi:hypothetical protein